MDDLSENLIEIHDLKYSRGPRVIFEGMNLEIKRGEITALMGPSGTGKTHVALALGLAACQKGYTVAFTTAAALVHELMEARDERRLRLRA